MLSFFQSSTAVSTDEKEEDVDDDGPVSVTSLKTIQLLVIDGDKRIQWKQIFDGRTVRLKGSDETKDEDESVPPEPHAIEVIQTGWDKIHLSSYGIDDVQVIAQDLLSGKTSQFSPDFVLIRNECRGVGRRFDFRHVLYGLMHGGVPSVNSIESIIMLMDRPVVHGALSRIQRRLGKLAFPLIEQTYYQSHHDMIIAPKFPVVVKIGHGHAGAGKILVKDHKQFEDVRSLVHAADNYCTAESYVEGEYDIRVQKIGHHYRALKRTSVSGNWKTNTGSSIGEIIPMTSEFQRWIDAASTLFGGLDICTVDAIRSKASGGDIKILEINGTSSGFFPACRDEDNGYVRDLVLCKMEKVLRAK